MPIPSPRNTSLYRAGWLSSSRIIRLEGGPQWEMIHSYGALEVQLGREIAVPALLNPQEHVWEHTRDAISHNHSYGSFGPLLADFETCLNETLFACDFIE